MTLLAAAKLSDEMLRLVSRSGSSAAIDWKLRYADVHRWFAGSACSRFSAGMLGYQMSRRPMGLWQA